jgi:hypothetical protein
VGAAALALAAPLASPAQAAYVVTLQQVGANVVATGSGSLNTSALGSSTLSGVTTWNGQDSTVGHLVTHQDARRGVLISGTNAV